MRYRAFFSYARADDRLANWLHLQLDGYRTPRALVGADGALGPVPAKLHPIFRDRTDLDARGHIDQRLQEALEGSECLVVLCTPTSAKSQWVNHECETFLKLGREGRIFPVIGAGEPNSGDPETECFPPALRGKGLLAADLREIKKPNGQLIGDGRDGGRVKLIAGLLGVSLDQLVQRERRRQRLLIGALGAAALVFAGLAVTAGGFGWLAQHNAKIASLNEQRAQENEQRALKGEAEAIASAAAEREARKAEDEARKAEIQQRDKADAATQRARLALRTGLQQLNRVTSLTLADISRRRAKDAKSIEILKATEEAYWTLRTIGSAQEFREVEMSRIMEQIASTYFNLGLSSDSQRAYERFVMLNRELAKENPNDSVWSSAYAASLLRLANEKRANRDFVGHKSSLQEAASIFRNICWSEKLQSTDGQGKSNTNYLRVISCVNFAHTTHELIMSHGRMTSDSGAARDALQAIAIASSIEPSNKYLATEGRETERKLRQLPTP